MTNFDLTKKQNIPGARKTTASILISFMGINEISLSPVSLALLYEEGLFTSPIPEKSGKKPLPDEIFSAYAYLGGNNRKICFLTDSAGDEFLPKEQFIFLNKMLAACKCSIDDIAVVNVNRKKLRLADLRNQLSPEILFLWGVSQEVTGIKIPLGDFEITSVDGMSVIHILSPERMNDSDPSGKDLKQRLWSCLKKLFAL